MKLTHWQYLAGLDALTSPCLTVSYVSKAGVCLTCGHDPNRDYKIRFTVDPLPVACACGGKQENTVHGAFACGRTVPSRATRRKAKPKGRPMPKATRALLGL